MVAKPDYSKIASDLINGKPLAFKSYPDGSLGVIAPTGQKFTFTPEQVAQHQTPEPEPKPTKPPTKAAKKK